MNIDEEKFILYRFKLEEKDEDLKDTVIKYRNNNINNKTKLPLMVDRLLRKKSKFDNKLKDFLYLVDLKKETYDAYLVDNEIILSVKKG